MAHCTRRRAAGRNREAGVAAFFATRARIHALDRGAKITTVSRYAWPFKHSRHRPLHARAARRSRRERCSPFEEYYEGRRAPYYDLGEAFVPVRAF